MSKQIRLRISLNEARVLKKVNEGFPLVTIDKEDQCEDKDYTWITLTPDTDTSIYRLGRLVHIEETLERNEKEFFKN